MHKNGIWFSFLVILTAATLWYSGSAIYKLYRYFQMTNEVVAEQIELKILELASDRYSIQADYSYIVENNRYYGSGIVTNYAIVNSWAAEQTMAEISSKPTIIWYSSKDPGNSMLHHSFPYKNVVSALIMIGLQLYFIRLGYHVGRKNLNYCSSKKRR